MTEWGCMQALIDFDGWRKWKEFIPPAPGGGPGTGVSGNLGGFSLDTSKASKGKARKNPKISKAKDLEEADGGSSSKTDGNSSGSGRVTGTARRASSEGTD